jgi:hypothetical protein
MLSLLRSALNAITPTRSIPRGMENKGKVHSSNPDKKNRGDKRKADVKVGWPSKHKEHMTRAQKEAHKAENFYQTNFTLKTQKVINDYEEIIN